MRAPTRTATLRAGTAVELRSPGPDDVAATLDYVRALFADAWRNLAHPPGFFAAMGVDEQARFLDGIAAHPRDFMLCAFHGGEVVGNSHVATEAGTFHRHVGVLGLGVLPAWRGRGLGRALTEALIEQATTNGVDNLWLRVRTFNAPAISLYETLGFRRVGTLRAVARLQDGTVADEHVYQRLAGGRAARSEA